MIPFHAILWDDPANPDGNVGHVARHGVTVDEVEDVIYGANSTDGYSRSSQCPARFGWTTTGKFLCVIYKVKQGRTLTTIKPVTAYEVDPH